MTKRQIVIGLALFAFIFLASSCLFMFIIATPRAYPITATLFFSASLVVPGILVIARPKRWLILAITAGIYSVVIGTTVTTYGKTHEWVLFSELRASWGRRMAPEALRSQLVVGDTPENVLKTVGIAPGILGGVMSYPLNGMSHDMVLEACGASTELIMPDDAGEREVSYFVWAYPICGGGCCDGAVVLTFHDNRLHKVEIYDPTTNPGPESDVARYVDGRIWSAISGAKKRFSAEKTLKQIRLSNPPSQLVLDGD